MRYLKHYNDGNRKSSLFWVIGGTATSAARLRRTQLGRLKCTRKLIWVKGPYAALKTSSPSRPGPFAWVTMRRDFNAILRKPPRRCGISSLRGRP